MEEDKAAAYYDELTRKGEGAARFKQGLGFSSHTNSSSNSSPPSSGSALASSSSSYLSNFVKSSATPTQISTFEKEAQLQSIQNKLKKKDKDSQRDDDRTSSRVSDRRDRHSSRSHSHSHSHRHRSRIRDREYRKRSRSRSRSRSRDGYRNRNRNRSISPRRSDSRNRSRSSSPRGKRRSENTRDRTAKDRNGGGVDYSKLIPGYDNMTAAEKVKARMKFQLNETVEKDTAMGMGSGWERFEFDKDAPLDDEEIEAAEDDVELVKHIGQSFRFSAVEARKEDQIKAAHDKAMFGAPVPGSMISDNEPEAVNNEKESTKTEVAASLLSEKMLAKQQGSWRDRARKAQAQ